MDDLLRDWVDNHPEWKVKGLMLRGRDYPVTGSSIEFDEHEHGEVWLLKSDDECLVIRAGDVLGIEVAKAESS